MVTSCTKPLYILLPVGNKSQKKEQTTTRDSVEEFRAETCLIMKDYVTNLMYKKSFFNFRFIHSPL